MNFPELLLYTFFIFIKSEQAIRNGYLIFESRLLIAQ